MDKTYDICVVGSGAGGAPLAWSLAKKGLNVLILEKGTDFNAMGNLKDELTLCRESPFVPKGDMGLREIHYGKHTVYDRQLWMGCTVGGGTRIMSGFFLPMNEKDFTPRTHFGDPSGATHLDWPITLTDIQPYYDAIAEHIGLSPKKHGNDGLDAHPAGDFLKTECAKLGIPTGKTPRAVLSKDKGERGSCSYSGLCGSYPCTTGAKGSTRDTYIQDAITTGNATLLTRRDVIRVETKGDAITAVKVIGPAGLETYKATTFVLALSAIETARLLLNSKPGGVANTSRQIGKNLTFTIPCEVTASFNRSVLAGPTEVRSPFIQQYTDFFRELPYPQLKYRHGGSVIFLFPHANPINRAISISYNSKGKRVLGQQLKADIDAWYKQTHITTDTFIDFLPNTHCHVSLSGKKDLFGRAIAKVHYNVHQESQKAQQVLGYNLQQMFAQMGPENVHMTPTFYTSGELQQGTCRFGDSPKYTVLNPDCRTHDLKNCYITDGSFFPSGISVPSTYTIMANSLRVAEKIIKG